MQAFHPNATHFEAGPEEQAAVLRQNLAGNARFAAPNPSGPEDLIAIDDPQEWEGFSQAVADQEGQRISQLSISGMYCAACSLNVEQALAALPGVSQVRVSAASRRASLKWDEALVRPSQMVQAVRVAGYDAVPANNLQAEQNRQKESRMALWRWLVACLCMMQVMMYAWPSYGPQTGELTPEMLSLLRWASWVLTLPVLLFSCGPFFMAAWNDVRNRRVGMDLTISLGILITFAVSSVNTFEPGPGATSEVYYDSLTMFVFLLLSSRWLEQRMRSKTAGALDELIRRLPPSVLRRSELGVFERAAVARVHAGDVVRVLPGEAFPADGVLTAGTTQVDEALLTGELHPLTKAIGSRVMAGSHNLGASVEVQVDKTGSETRFAQILALMERAAADKPRLAQLADRVARPFLGGVLLAAAGAAVYTGVSGGWVNGSQVWMNAAIVLIVTCPCALSLATPTAMLAAAGSLARAGVQVRRLQALQDLAEIDTVMLDKTGTLTQEALALKRVQTRPDLSKEQALALAAQLAQHSLHPASKALLLAAKNSRSGQLSREDLHGEFAIGDVSEVPGQGLKAGRWKLGNAAFCKMELPAPELPTAMLAHLTSADQWVATFTLEEELRPLAATTVGQLRSLGLWVELLSGDDPDRVERLGRELQLDGSRGGCSPKDKLRVVQQAQAMGHRVLMVGDGINDGPVLAAANVSVAMGSGLALAHANSDLVLLGGGLSHLVAAIEQARRTMRVVRQNMGWALAYNLVCVPLAVAGWLSPWQAGAGMALSSLVVVANATRLARMPNPLENP